MKFTLVFEGELRANGTPAQKQTIREQLHPQLKELCDTHPCLQGLKSRRYLSLEDDIGTIYYDHHHSKPVPLQGGARLQGMVKMMKLTNSIFVNLL